MNRLLASAATDPAPPPDPRRQSLRFAMPRRRKRVLSYRKGCDAKGRKRTRKETDVDAASSVPSDSPTSTSPLPSVDVSPSPTEVAAHDGLSFRQPEAGGRGIASATDSVVTTGIPNVPRPSRPRVEVASSQEAGPSRRGTQGARIIDAGPSMQDFQPEGEHCSNC